MGLSHKQFLGVFDADGGIRMGVIKRRKRKKIIFEVYFHVSQSEKNKDLLLEIQKLFGGGQIVEKKRTKDLSKHPSKEYEYRAHYATKEGQAILACLTKHKPILPSKRHDYLIAKEIINILNKTKPKNLNNNERLLLVNLCYQNSSELETDNTVIKKEPINNVFDKMGATVNEGLLSLQKLTPFLNEVAQLDKNHELSLQDRVVNGKMLTGRKLSFAYMSGFHIGDGSFGLNYYYERGVLKVRPIWSITDPSKLLLRAFQRTLKKYTGCVTQCGTIVPVGPNAGNCFQFRIAAWKYYPTGVIPIFDNCYLPKARMKQFKDFVSMCNIGVNSLQTTEKGWLDLLEIGYDMNNNASQRELTKDEIAIVGVNQIKKRNRPLYGDLFSYLKKKWTPRKRKKRPKVEPIFKFD